MKMNKILLVGLVLLLLCSCSKDNEAQQSNSFSELLLKKLVYNDDNGNIEEYSFAYDGNKLISITSSKNKYKHLFTYNTDVIVKIETFDENNKLYSLENYTYNNGKVASYSLDYLNDPFKTRTVYTYNIDSSILFEKFSTYKPTDIESDHYQGKIFYKNGNLVKEEHFKKDGIKFTVLNFKYDGSIAPLKNITGYNLLIDKLPYYLGAGGVNNCTEITETDFTPILSTINTIFEYVYNENGYPKSAKMKYTEDNIIKNYTAEYFY